MRNFPQNERQTRWLCPLEGTGDVRADLTSFCERLLSGRVRVGSRVAILPAMVAESVHNPEIAEIFRNTYFRPRRAAEIEIVRAAKRRDDIGAHIDEVAMIDLLAGLVWYRRLVLGVKLDPDDAGNIVTIALDGALARRRLS
jgi:hypothetical protein